MLTLYTCPTCDSLEVELCFPVWVCANDVDNRSLWELDGEAAPEKDSDRGWCSRCEDHVLVRKLRLEDLEQAFSDACRGEKDKLMRLATVLSYGGTLPDGTQAEALDPERFRDDGLFELAAAARVAIAYGDLSGLQGLGYPPRGGEC